MSRPAGRDRWLTAARIVFVLATLALAAWGLWPRRGEIGAALAEVSPGRMVAAYAVVMVGLGLTLELWRGILKALRHSIPRAAAARVFFVGQLGKYLPGSVWSVAMQADLARDLQVPMRRTATCSLLFLGANVASALAVGGASAAALDLPGLPRGGWIVLALIGVLGLTPWVVNAVGCRLAGERVQFGWGTQLWSTVRVTGAWGAYAGALVLMAPALQPHWWVVVAASTLAYAVGVVVVIAPAGVGAREVVFVLMLAPVLDTPSAVALALLARVVHTLADVSWAAVGVLWAHFDRVVRVGVE